MEVECTPALLFTPRFFPVGRLGSILQLLYGVQLLLMFYVARNTFKETPPNSLLYFSLDLVWCGIKIYFGQVLMYLSFLGRNLLGGPDLFLIPESVKTWLVLDKAGNWTEKFLLLFCTFYFLWPCIPSASLASSLHTLYWALPVSIFTKICCFEIIWDLQKSRKNNVKSSRVPFILLPLMLLS